MGAERRRIEGGRSSAERERRIWRGRSEGEERRRVGGGEREVGWRKRVGGRRGGGGMRREGEGRRMKGGGMYEGGIGYVISEGVEPAFSVWGGNNVAFWDEFGHKSVEHFSLARFVEFFA